jgi:hypothetical protein
MTVALGLDLDWRILAFTTPVAVATALLFGTAPALRASRVAPNEALKEQGRGLSADRRFVHHMRLNVGHPGDARVDPALRVLGELASAA